MSFRGPRGQGAKKKKMKKKKGRELLERKCGEKKPSGKKNPDGVQRFGLVNIACTGGGGVGRTGGRRTKGGADCVLEGVKEIKTNKGTRGSESRGRDQSGTGTGRQVRSVQEDY